MIQRPFIWQPKTDEEELGPLGPRYYPVQLKPFSLGLSESDFAF